MDQKLVLDQFESGSKVGLRWNWVMWSLMSKRNSGGSKWVGIHMVHVTTSFTYFTGSKVGPPRICKDFTVIGMRKNNCVGV